jgi:hypothetical protein
MNYEMTTKQLLDAAEPASRYVPAATAELITGLANAVRQLTEQRDVLVADNWNLRDVMRKIIAARPGGVYFNKWEPLIFKALNETPAIAAAFSSLRAEGWICSQRKCRPSIQNYSLEVISTGRF